MASRSKEPRKKPNNPKKGDEMYFTDPSKCSRCQNHGWFDDLAFGRYCHRCITRGIMNACVTANVRRGNIALALRQLRMIGV